MTRLDGDQLNNIKKKEKKRETEGSHIDNMRGSPISFSGSGIGFI